MQKIISKIKDDVSNLLATVMFSGTPCTVVILADRPLMKKRGMSDSHQYPLNLSLYNYVYVDCRRYRQFSSWKSD